MHIKHSATILYVFNFVVFRCMVHECLKMLHILSIIFAISPMLWFRHVFCNNILSFSHLLTICEKFCTYHAIKFYWLSTTCFTTRKWKYTLGTFSYKHAIVRKYLFSVLFLAKNMACILIMFHTKLIFSRFLERKIGTNSLLG